jgi:addiction module RelE/StbE family toxin
MARRIDWSPSALDDLDSAAEYIARDSPRYAAAFVREIRAASRSLKEFAERGRIVPEFSDPAIRELFVHRYRLIYAVRTDRVVILGVIHGARDFTHLWRSEEREPPIP